MPRNWPIDKLLVFLIELNWYRLYTNRIHVFHLWQICVNTEHLEIALESTVCTCSILSGITTNLERGEQEFYANLQIRKLSF